MALSSQLSLLVPTPPVTTANSAGVVYTRRWAVDLILDLAGYDPAEQLVDALAVEPSAGHGAFVVAMAERLIESCRRQSRPWSDCASSLLAFELNEASAQHAQTAVVQAMVRRGVSRDEAISLARGWIRTGDYLASAPRLPKAKYVVGNPPYIRLEDFAENTLQFYRSTYPTMRGRADIYVGFFEAALRQLTDGGVCAFICADRWMSNQYGATLRAFVTETFAVEAVVSMHKADPFEQDVAAYPAVTLIRRATQISTVVATLDSIAQQTSADQIAAAIKHTGRDDVDRAVPLMSGLRAARVKTWMTGTDPWPCTSPERLKLLARLEAEFEPLENESTKTRVGIGVASGCDAVFITTDAECVESSRLLPLAMVADTLGGTVKWSGHYLVNPWVEDGLVELAKFPRLNAYFAKHSEQIRARHVAQRRPEAWFRTIDRVTVSLATKHKLYLPDMRSTIHPVLDCGKTYPHHNLYFITSEVWDLEVLGGLLLSAIGQFFVEVYGVRMRGGWLRFQAQYLRRIRVPRPESVSEMDAEMLRKAFRARDVLAATAIAKKIYRIEGSIPTETT